MQNLFYGSIMVAMLIFIGWPETVGKMQHERYNAFMIGWDSVK